MRTHTEIRFAVVSLLALQALTAVGGILLLGRLGPVVEHVLDENDFSLAAVGDAEAVLVETRGPLAADEAVRLSEAFSKLAGNVTEAEEPALVTALQTDLAAVVAGNLNARRRFHENLLTLSQINRAAMHAANDKASRLARAGAWTLVVLALATLTVGLFGMGRARRRLIEPLDRVSAVAQAWRRGDRLRRTGGVHDSANDTDLALVAAVLDELLDVAAGGKRDVPDSSGPLRTALVALLEQRPGPVAVVDADGGLIVANLRALDQVAEVGQALRGDGAATVTDLGGGLRLVELPAEGAPQGT